MRRIRLDGGFESTCRCVWIDDVDWLLWREHGLKERLLEGSEGRVNLLKLLLLLLLWLLWLVADLRLEQRLALCLIRSCNLLLLLLLLLLCEPAVWIHW